VSETSRANKDSLDRKLIHDHAFQLLHASVHAGVPRLSARTALRIAATLAAIARSSLVDEIMAGATANPDTALREVDGAVRLDEEQRQRDELAVTTQAAAAIDASLNALSSTT